MGYIIWEGSSLLDDEPIVLLLTGIHNPSQNIKTGPMIQSWILRSDMHPMEALETGSDQSICGQCPLRGNGTKNRACYVRPMGVNQIYKGYSNNKHKQFKYAKHDHLIRWKTLRLGAYGDPAAVPFEVWEPLLKLSTGHTGYTHQWRTCDQRWSEQIMASVESLDDAWAAHQMGWRTYRIRQPGEKIEADEKICPGSKEAHKSRQCISCMMCNGTKGEESSNIVILQH